MLIVKNQTYQNSLKWIAITFLVVFIVCGCSSDSVGPKSISMYELIVHHEDYIGDELIVRGYLSRFVTDELGPIHIYPSKSDADMRNYTTAVFVDLLDNPWIVNLEGCINQQVEIQAFFRQTQNPYNPVFGFTDVMTLATQGENQLQFTNYCVLEE